MSAVFCHNKKYTALQCFYHLNKFTLQHIYFLRCINEINIYCNNIILTVTHLINITEQIQSKQSQLNNLWHVYRRPLLGRLKIAASFKGINHKHNSVKTWLTHTDRCRTCVILFHNVWCFSWFVVRVHSNGSAILGIICVAHWWCLEV